MLSIFSISAIVLGLALNSIFSYYTILAENNFFNFTQLKSQSEISVRFLSSSDVVNVRSAGLATFVKQVQSRSLINKRSLDSIEEYISDSSYELY